MDTTRHLVITRPAGTSGLAQARLHLVELAPDAVTGTTPDGGEVRALDPVAYDGPALVTALRDALDTPARGRRGGDRP